MSCYSVEQLALFLEGRFTEDETSRLDEHLRDCEACRRTLDRLSRSDETLPAAPTEPNAGAVALTPADEQLIERLPDLARVLIEIESEGRSPNGAATGTGDGVEFDEQRRPRIPGLQILGRLGHGATGIVYEAYDLNLRRRVAVKVIWRERLSSELRERVRVEAEAAARLNHPNVVQVFSFGETEGRPYVVLEFVGGGTLAQRMLGRPLAPCDAATIARKMARGIAFAHKLNIVHRDLNPTNVLLDGDSRAGVGAMNPKIADFGLAKILDSEQKWTRTGQFLGTPAYAAPEQLSGETAVVSAACDIYALGAILYELLTGRPPHQADDVWLTMKLVVDADPVPPRRLQPGVSPDLETICLKCLEKSPARRYSSADELADDLDRFLANLPIAARPIGPVERGWRWAARNRRFAVTLAALCAVVLSSLIGAIGAAIYFRRLEATERQLATDNRQLAAQNAAARHEAELRSIELSRQLSLQALQRGDTVAALALSAATIEERNRSATLNARTGEGGTTRHFVTPESEVAGSRLRAANALAQLPKPILRVAVHAEPEGSASDARPTWRRLHFVDEGRRLALSDGWGECGAAVDFEGDQNAVFLRARSLLCDDQEWTFEYDRRGESGDELVVAPLRGEAEPIRLAAPKSIAGRWRQAWRCPRGRALAAMCEAGDRGHVYIWLLPQGELTSEKPLVVELQPGMAQFSDDLVMLSFPRSAVVRELKSEIVRFQREFPSAILSAMSPQGKHGAICGGDRISFLILAPPPLDLSEFGGDASIQGGITAVEFSESRAMLALGGADGRVVLWAMGEKVQRRQLWHLTSGSVSLIRFQPRGDLVAAVTHGGTLTVRHVATGDTVVPDLPHRRAIVDLKWSPDGRRIAALTSDRLVTVWDLSELKSSLELRNSPLASNQTMLLSSDSTKLISTREKDLEVWDLNDGRKAAEFALDAPFGPNAYDTLKTALVTMTGSSKPSFNRGRVAVYDWQARTAKFSDDIDLPPVPRPPVVSPDRRRILCGDAKGGRLLDSSDLSIVAAIKTKRGESMRHALFTPDGLQLVVVGVDGRVAIWDLESLTEVRSWPLPEGDPNPGLGIDRTGRFLLAWGQFGLFAWELATGWQAFRSSADESGFVTALVFSQDGEWFATVRQQRLVQVWSLRDWRRVGKAIEAPAPVLELRFAANSEAIAMLYFDRGGDLWDWRHGERLASTPFQRLPHKSATLTRDGRRSIFLHSDGAIRVWDWTIENLPDDELVLLARQFNHAPPADDERPLSAAELATEWRKWRRATQGRSASTEGPREPQPSQAIP